MKLTPLDASFGATVEDLSLAAIAGGDDEAGWQALYDAWIEYGLLIAPAQHLSRAEQVALARRFGDLELFAGEEIVALSNVREDGSIREADGMVEVLKGNMGWHADSTYMPLQAKGAVFTAEVVPDEGGGTGWADMRAAYDALDEDTREKVESRSAYHSLAYSQAKLGHHHEEGDGYLGYGFEGHDAPLRPLVKVHPVTGRKSLCIGRHAYGIPGLEPEESERFLADLVTQACQAPRVYEHAWQPGDAVIWDNRCLLHRGLPWDMTKPRIMWHSRIAGDPATEMAVA